jgi:hypothetical protein
MRNLLYLTDINEKCKSPADPGGALTHIGSKAFITALSRILFVTAARPAVYTGMFFVDQNYQRVCLESQPNARSKTWIR